jgi:hypothetical protein
MSGFSIVDSKTSSSCNCRYSSCLLPLPPPSSSKNQMQSNLPMWVDTVHKIRPGISLHWVLWHPRLCFEFQHYPVQSHLHLCTCLSALGVPCKSACLRTWVEDNFGQVLASWHPQAMVDRPMKSEPCSTPTLKISKNSALSNGNFRK